jgi:Carboxypeptidase regulatory-like domain
MKNCLPVLFVFAGLGSSVSFAQYGIVDCVMQRKLVVARVQGQVFDPSGIPVPGVLVALSRDGMQIAETTTGPNGKFALNLASGSYHFRAKLRGFEATTADLDVGRDIANLVHRKTLKVILALPAMDCPWVTTSNKELRQLVRSRTAQK